MVTVVIEPPTEEPVSLSDAQLHLRIEQDQTEEAELIKALITAAREAAEAYTERALAEQTLRSSWDGFPCGPLLLRGPVREVLSVKYVDTDGQEQELGFEEYQLDTDAVPARLLPAPGNVWPATQARRARAVTVEFKAGYGSDRPIPERVRQAMLLTIGHWYANREAVNVGNIVNEMPLAVKFLLDPLRTFIL